MANQLTSYDERTTLARANHALCRLARVTAALKCEGAISVEADLIRVPATANVDGEAASSTQSHTHIGTGHDDIGSTTGDGMNKQMRRHPRQSGSASSAGVQVAGLACEVPVVSTRISGIPELVEDGVTGLLVPPADPAALADALERLAHDPELGARLGRAGRAKVLREFELANNTTQLAHTMLGEAR